MKNKGGLNHQPAQFSDIMSTCVELAGATYPKEYQGRAILPTAGQSILPIVKGKKMPERYIYAEHEGNRMVRKGDWKLVSANFKGDEWELYNIKEDRTDLDLLFGCLLEWGLPLSMPYTSEEISGCTVHTYNDGDLIACFDENIPDEVVKTIAKRQPLRAVFRDSSFNGSPAKINVTEVFKLLAPDTRVKVI